MLRRGLADIHLCKKGDRFLQLIHRIILLILPESDIY